MTKNFVIWIHLGFFHFRSLIQYSLYSVLTGTNQGTTLPGSRGRYVVNKYIPIKCLQACWVAISSLDMPLKPPILSQDNISALIIYMKYSARKRNTCIASAKTQDIFIYILTCDTQVVEVNYLFRMCFMHTRDHEFASA
jgi:hypothetical protein